MEDFIIVPARDAEDAQVIERLAHEIWHEHYASLLKVEQIDYMLNKFQSAEAISQDMRRRNYIYYLAYADSVPAGYCAIHPEDGGKTVFLSKIYVKKEFRGKKLATQFLHTILEEAEPWNCQKIWLTVNKYNTGSIAAYKKLGFSIEDAMVTDIGSGFVMDDYKMVRPVA